MNVTKKPQMKKKGAAAGVRAVILAGGRGVRLQPFTVNFPKPLVPLGDTPVIEILMRRLVSFGVTDITLTLGYLAELIKAYFGHRQKLAKQVRLRYVDEDKPTGTAGSLSLVSGLDKTFLVMNGDLLTTLDYGAMMHRHMNSGAVATIGVFPREVKIDFGVLEIGAQGQLVNYLEKPKYEYWVSMGVNAFHQSVLDFIPRGRYLDIPTLMLNLKKAGKQVMTFRSECEWLDIGRPDDYEQAVKLFEETKHRYLKEEQ
jgi:NDP-sugar pyrophosphorylase family protein